MGVTRKQAVIDAIKHRDGDRCPYTFVWEPDSDIDRRLDAHYGNPQWRTSYRNYIVRCGVIEDGRRVYQPGPPLREDYFGSVWRTDHKPIHMETPVLQKPSLKGYAFPDIDRFVPRDWERQVRDSLQENADCFTTVYPGFGLFERSWAMRGFSEVLVDTIQEPEFFRDLIAAIAENHMHPLLDRLLELPVDGIFFGDDWGDQRGVIIGPERWQAVLKPVYRELYQKTKVAGKIVLSHCCGSIVDIIPDLLQIGLEVLESVQPEARGMRPYELKDRFGDKLAFWGGLGSQSIIPRGTPDELRQEIRRLVAHMSDGGGYILSGAKALQVETPTQNAAAILEEFVAAGEAT